MDLVRKDVEPRDIVTRDAFDNALALDMAMGGSTNYDPPHAGGGARGGGVVRPGAGSTRSRGKDADAVQGCRRRSQYHMEDVDRAGDPGDSFGAVQVPGLMKRGCLTVTGKTLEENVAGAADEGPGGHPAPVRRVQHGRRLAVLYGNPRDRRSGSFKTAGCRPRMLRLRGVRRDLRVAGRGVRGILGAR